MSVPAGFVGTLVVLVSVGTAAEAAVAFEVVEAAAVAAASLIVATEMQAMVVGCTDTVDVGWPIHGVLVGIVCGVQMAAPYQASCPWVLPHKSLSWAL
ncbi:hypothetical protein P691DRAFT_766758 [Macrolepiota fuliginosa MF-IS2]|uniref:Secreted protein n=1 Tax=Macrolepiota fuliginosa MF-IS2 TaxID=1400762 RepID=A0A9P6BX20_9AGAR|nr:hypothetical protein P691DRAFT_766758 [Macrolepiota fuliginosa MF-IS2]